ncbi:Ion channel regulatory protein UNC-93 [Mactra antiquata]
MDKDNETMDTAAREELLYAKSVADEGDKPIVIESVNTPTKTLEMSKCGVTKNLIVISVAFMFLFSAFNSFTSLQSSLNKEDGLGTTGLAVLYTMMLLSSLIMTPVSMSKLSSKWVMVISMFTYLIYVCTGFYSSCAFNSFTSLQSSLNKEDGLGTTGLAVLYTMTLLSSLIMTPVSMSKLSSKWVMVISMFTYLIYVCTGFYSSWYTIIPASVIIGTGASHLWLASQYYITDLARHYALLTGTKVQDILTLFLGIYFGFLYACNIWGNLISSFVFRRDEVNTTLAANGQFCGPNFCPYIESNSTNIIEPAKKQVYLFAIACCGFVIVAMFLTIVLVTDISTESTTSNVCTLIQQVSRQMCTSRTQHLLFFPSLLGGLTFGFLSSDFTQAYVSCSYGVKNVGFSMVVYGIFQSAGSILFGKLNQYTGHLVIYIFGCMVQIGLHLTMLIWTPVASQQFVIYILATLFGIAGAINVPVVAGLSCISLIVQHIRYKRRQKCKEESL